jgi:hypothetical protein
VKKSVTTKKHDLKKAKLTQALAEMHEDHEVSEDDDDKDE